MSDITLTSHAPQPKRRPGRRSDRFLILGALAELGGLTRFDLAIATGLKGTALHSLLARLVAAGLVKEASIPRQKERGQPERVYWLAG
jgi:predicted ArsR family transcriptional regulator